MFFTLENPQDDAQKLYRDFGLVCAGLVELGSLARHADSGFDERCVRFVSPLLHQHTTHRVNAFAIRVNYNTQSLGQAPQPQNYQSPEYCCHV